MLHNIENVLLDSRADLDKQFLCFQNDTYNRITLTYKYQLFYFRFITEFQQDREAGRLKQSFIHTTKPIQNEYHRSNEHF
jgi:hypothetical protein